MTIAAGIDVGTGAVKAALFRVADGRTEWLARAQLRIRQRDPMELARVAFDQVLADAALTEKQVDYVATTGEGESVPFHTGHFYSMTTHARGAVYLDPEARAAIDVGALHGRVLGVIQILNKVSDREFTQDDLDLMLVVAQLSVTAMHRAERAGDTKPA